MFEVVDPVHTTGINWQSLLVTVCTVGVFLIALTTFIVAQIRVSRKETVKRFDELGDQIDGVKAEQVRQGTRLTRIESRSRGVRSGDSR